MVWWKESTEINTQKLVFLLEFSFLWWETAKLGMDHHKDRKKNSRIAPWMQNELSIAVYGQKYMEFLFGAVEEFTLGCRLGFGECTRSTVDFRAWIR